MADDKILRMQQLISELNEASEAYYNGLPERMTDFEWDARFDELKQLEAQTATVLPDSPTQKVSEDTISRTERGARVCCPLIGQDQADCRTREMGRATPHLDFVEVGWSDAGGHLRRRQADKGCDAWQRTHRHQHHAPGTSHQRHSTTIRLQGTYRDSRRGRHLLRGLRPLPHGEW